MTATARKPHSAALAVGVLALMAAMVLAYGVTAPLSRASADAADQAAAEVVSALRDSTDASSQTPGDAGSGATNPLSRPIVAVVGDSLAFSAASEIDAALRDDGMTPVLQVAPGRRIPAWGLDGQISPGLDVVRALRRLDPSVWVIQLGTNDIVAEPFDRGRYGTLIRSVLDLTGPGVPVVWVSVHRADHPAESSAFDDVLREVSAAQPELTIADWASVAGVEPVLADDGVHLSANGIPRFAEVLAGAVRSAGSDA
jgi:hypothetical protein